jgi:hypothetical protein
VGGRGSAVVAACELGGGSGVGAARGAIGSRTAAEGRREEPA